MNATTGTTAPARPRRAWNRVLWALQALTALGFLAVALQKFTGAPNDVTTFRAIGLGDWFRYFVGALEVAGAAGLLIPRLVGLAALGLVALMAGALLTQLFVVGSGAAMPLPYLVAAGLIAWGRRRSTVQLWRAFRPD